MACQLLMKALILTVDVSRLSFAELTALRAQLDQQIAEKRSEELKVLTDGFVKKLEAAGFTADEGMQALRPYLAGSGRKANQGAAAPVLFRDPSDPTNTWSGRGRAPRWLQDHIAAGRSKEEFKA